MTAARFPKKLDIMSGRVLREMTNDLRVTNRRVRGVLHRIGNYSPTRHRGLSCAGDRRGHGYGGLGVGGFSYRDGCRKSRLWCLSYLAGDCRINVLKTSGDPEAR